VQAESLHVGHERTRKATHDRIMADNQRIKGQPPPTREAARERRTAIVLLGALTVLSVALWTLRAVMARRSASRAAVPAANLPSARASAASQPLPAERP